MPAVDPRRVVGGSVWAKSTAISNDSRRIFGVEANKLWVEGVILEVLVNRPEGARRATTVIKARYKIGDTEKTAVIGLAQLKKQNPVAEPAEPAQPAAVAPTAPEPAVAIANGASPDNITAPPAVAANAPPPGTSQSGLSSLSASTAGSSRVPVATAHGVDWYVDANSELPVNGAFVRKTWKVTDQYTGQDYTPGCDSNKELRPIDFFMAVFPKKQLSMMVEKTSERLAVAGKPRLTKGELLKWFGVLILITRFEFGERDRLWRETSTCKYIPSPSFGQRTGMTRDRFNDIFRYMVWSQQPQERPPGMSSESYRWLLVQDFVDNFNEHRSSFFLPGWLVCVDESISRWYGLGGHWINMGLPMYVSIDRKPEDGLEIQNACCAHSGIMYQLKLVKTADSNAE